MSYNSTNHSLVTFCKTNNTKNYPDVGEKFKTRCSNSQLERNRTAERAEEKEEEKKKIERERETRPRPANDYTRPYISRESGRRGPGLRTADFHHHHAQPAGILVPEGRAGYVCQRERSWRVGPLEP